MKPGVNRCLKLSIALILILSCYRISQAQTVKDTLTKKENFLLSLFPNDCMAIFRLSLNPSIKVKLDSIRNKFLVYLITVRQKPGLGSIVFEKLSESVLPDSFKYILLKVNFKYEGKNEAYSTSTEGTMNCDTLKSTFTLPVIQRISKNVLNADLASKVFDQPIGESAAVIFNLAVFTAIDSLLALFNTDRVHNLSIEIERLLQFKQDSILKQRKVAKNGFALARKELLKLMQFDNLDTSLYFGNYSQYANEGMSSLFQNNTDSEEVSVLSHTDIQLDTLFKLDIQLINFNLIADNIHFLLKDALYPFSRRIMREIEKNNSEIDEFLSERNRAQIVNTIRKYYEKFSLQQLKQLLINN